MVVSTGYVREGRSQAEDAAPRRVCMLSPNGWCMGR
jgi:hypothetical protein